MNWLRRRLRQWLGIEVLEDRRVEDSGWLAEHDRNVKSLRDDIKRIDTVLETIARQQEAIAKNMGHVIFLVQACRSVPILRQAERKFIASQQIAMEEAQRKAKKELTINAAKDENVS